MRSINQTSKDGEKGASSLLERLAEEPTRDSTHKDDDQLIPFPAADSTAVERAAMPTTLPIPPNTERSKEEAPLEITLYGEKTVVWNDGRIMSRVATAQPHLEAADAVFDPIKPMIILHRRRLCCCTALALLFAVMGAAAWTIANRQQTASRSFSAIGASPGGPGPGGNPGGNPIGADPGGNSIQPGQMEPPTPVQSTPSPSTASTIVPVTNTLEPTINFIPNATLPFQTTDIPTTAPTDSPISKPTLYPSYKYVIPAPTTMQPSNIPTTMQPSNEPTPKPPDVLRFYAIGDVPYNITEKMGLEDQLRALPDDADFMIHVGDIRDGAVRTNCERYEYEDVAELLQLSPMPVLVVLGDNEWNDCANMNEAFGYWKDNFEYFATEHWYSRTQDWNMQRQPGRNENFAMIQKDILIMGLNMVGVPVRNVTEWTTRLADNFHWSSSWIGAYHQSQKGVGRIGRVVIFFHGYPDDNLIGFFEPFRQFVQNELQNELPILLVHGDMHRWSYDTFFDGNESVLRIMLSGGVKEAPLKVNIESSGEPAKPWNAFLIERNSYEW